MQSRTYKTMKPFFQWMEMGLLCLLVTISIGLPAQNLNPRPYPLKEEGQIHDLSNPQFHSLKREMVKSHSLPPQPGQPELLPRTLFTMALDSIVQYSLVPDLNKTAKVSYQYHPENNRLKRQESTSTDPMTGIITYGFREEYTYNSQDQPETYSVFFYNTSLSEFYIFGRDTFIYNAEGFLTENIVTSYEGGISTPDTRSLYTYNQSDLLTKTVEFSWSKETKTWKEQYKYDDTYTPQTKLQQRIISFYSAGSWIPLVKDEYAYGQGLLLRIESSEWQQTTWRLTNRIDFKYDNQGNLIERLESIRDKIAPIWIPDVRYRFSYNSTKQLISSNYYVLLGQPDWWEPRDSSFYTYDILDNNLSEANYSWVYTNGGEWNLDNQISHAYDIHILLQDILWPTNPISGEMETLPFTCKRLSTVNNDFSNSSWDSLQYHYSIISSSVEVLTSPDLFYPNPANDFVYLQLPDEVSTAELQLFTTDGKPVHTFSIQPDHTFPVQSLPAGIYVYLLRHGKAFYAGKLIIQR